MRLVAVLVLAACGSPPVVRVTAPPAPPAPGPAASAPIQRAAPACRSAITGAMRDIVDSRGAKLAVVPVSTAFVTATAWAGDDLVIVRRLAEIGYGDRIQTAIERWSPTDGRAPKGRALLAQDTRGFALSPDGASAVLASTNAITLVDLATGVVETRISVAGDVTQLALAGTGDKLVVIAAVGGKIAMFDRAGRALDTYVLDGTTPTITRVYGADPEHPGDHSNILGQMPSWAVGFAVTPDLRYLAIGGSDSKVRLVDRVSQAKPKLLEIVWKYSERRLMGGNPDLNSPLAMRFSDDGKRLVVVHHHGEVVTWDTARGVQVAKLAVGCTRDEASALANQFTDPDDPPHVPSAQDIAACGAATSAAIAPDGSWYASNVGLIRIRALPSGRPIAMLKDFNLPEMLAISKRGVLALVDLYGRAGLWTASDGTRELLPTPPATGPLVPALSATGRLLAFDRARTTIVWDLVANKQIGAGLRDRIVAITDDATKTIVQTGSGYELRGDPAGAGETLAFTDGKISFSAAGRHAMNVVIATGDVIVRDLDAKTDVRIKPGRARAALRTDGKRVATFAETVPLQIWDTATGAVIATFDKGVRAFAFFPDGRRIAYVVQSGRTATGKVRDIAKGRSIDVPLTSWINDIAIAPDSSEVLFAGENTVTRYSFTTHTPRDQQILGLALRVHYTRDGAAVIFEHYDKVEIRAVDDDLTLLAHVYPLPSGGYLAKSAAGAVAGSADAVAHVVTRATLGRDVTVLEGSATWSRWVQPDVVACALSGAIAGPP